MVFNLAYTHTMVINWGQTIKLLIHLIPKLTMLIIPIV